MEAVAKCHFALVDPFDTLHGDRGHVHHDEGEDDDTDLLLCLSVFFLLKDHVVPKEYKEVSNHEKHSICGKVVALLILDSFKIVAR